MKAIVVTDREHQHILAALELYQQYTYKGALLPPPQACMTEALLDEEEAARFAVKVAEAK